VDYHHFQEMICYSLALLYYSMNQGLLYWNDGVWLVVTVGMNYSNQIGMADYMMVAHHIVVLNHIVVSLLLPLQILGVY
jgi:hypothetical protein